MCCRQQLLLAALLIICSGSSGVLIGCAAGRSSDDSSVMGSFTSLRTVHKYSESAREIMVERYGDDHPAVSWPVQGSIEYYQLLRNHDGSRLAAAASGSRRHLLSTTSSTTAYTFMEGNETERNGDFFYAFIDIGTPGAEYFVALDTASDLLWVPCECQQCAPLPSPGTANTSNSIGNTYSPSSSSTSQPVNCSNPLCSINQTTCAAASQDGSCPYTQSNFYSDTNSSGFLVEDNLYFIPEYGGKPVSVPVVFGCGQTQTGYFLNGVLAPDGVLGLGTGEISVPSTLRRELGLLDSFSICNNISGTGRIAFGDKGPITQQTTPFVSNSSQENLVEITAVEVGNKSIPVGLNASFDTLVYYTYLPPAIYTQFANTYTSLINLPNLNLTALGLDLCFATTNQSIEIPNLSFIFPNGETFKSVAYLAIEYKNQTGFCLGIQNSTLPEIIIGLLSMYDYSFTFNQEDKLVGWIPSTCFDDITASAPAPAPIFAPISTPTFSTPPSPPPPSSAPTSPSPPSLSTKLSPSTGPSTAPPPSAGVMEFVLPSRIISLSLLGFLLYLSLL
ncbi:hypothetical protein CY35_11G017700 [Sphagnum magellanicum]|nr:hypothetical protein CY35_11G017700 [Sphagnum magellanicum]